MRMLSSHRFFRVEDYGPLRRDTASPYSGMKDLETMLMASSHLHSRNENYETVRMVSSRLVGVAVGPYRCINPYLAGFVDRALPEIVA